MGSLLAGVTVVLRADADMAMGYGHFVRLSQLGAELAESGADVHLVTRMPKPPVGAVAVPETVSHQEEATWYAATYGEADVALLDLYVPEEEQIAGWRNHTQLIVAVDDAHPKFEFGVDLLVCPALATNHQRFPEFGYLAGSDYVLLRKGFGALGRHSTRENVRHVVVCFGGSDPRRLTPLVVERLIGSTSIPHLEVMLGVGFDGVHEMRDLAAGNDRIELVVDEPHVERRMSRADVGILGAGTLAYEAAASGLPSVLVSVTDGQEREAQALDDAGVAVHIPVRSLNSRSFAVALNTLGSQATRRAMSRAGRTMIDGAGTRRVADRIARLWTERR